MATISESGSAAAAAALSWLWPCDNTHTDEHISAGFAAVLGRTSFDVDADADLYEFEQRDAYVISIDWSGATTGEVESEDAETVTFRVKVPATVEFVTRFDFPGTRHQVDDEHSLGFQIVKTKRTFVFSVSMTVGMVAGLYGEPDIKAVEVRRPSLTALYGPIDPFTPYEERRT